MSDRIRDPFRRATLTHANLTFGESSQGYCLTCEARTELVTVRQWKTSPESGGDVFVEPVGEVSGHYCRACNRLTAVFLNNL